MSSESDIAQYRNMRDIRYLNHGKPFRAVQFVHKDTGKMTDCIIDEARTTRLILFYWKAGSYLLSKIPFGQLEILNPNINDADKYFIPVNLVEDMPPEGTFYETFEMSLGIIGKHIRMQIQYPDGDLELPSTVFVTKLENRETEFETLLQNKKCADFVEYTPERIYYTVPDRNTIGTNVIIKKRVNTPDLISLFAYNGFTAYMLKKDEFKIVDYLPDRMTRAESNWKAQWEVDPASAGPVRDSWRWRTTHLPKNWKSVYTLPGYAREIARDILGNDMSEFPSVERILDTLNKITYPMRNYVIEQIELSINETRKKISSSLEQLSNVRLDDYQKLVEDFNSTGDIDERRILQCKLEEFDKDIESLSGTDNLVILKMNSISEKLRDTSKLISAKAQQQSKKVIPTSKPQMMQLNKSIYAIDYAPYSLENKNRLRHLVLLFAVHGTHGRINGTYKRSGLFRGLADELRVFAGESTEALSSAFEHGDVNILPAKSINRLKKEGGKLLGTGGRGYKGIHAEAKKAKKIYKPRWNMKRTMRIDAEARATKKVEI